MVKGIRSLKSLPAFPGNRDSSVLKKVTFHNLRAFGNEAVVPIAPINLIFGNNNAGKSSIFHSFLWIREVLEKGDLNVHRPEPSGNYIDLGGIKNFVHKNANGDLSKEFGFSFEINIPLSKKKTVAEAIVANVVSEIKQTLQFICTFRRFMKGFDSKKVMEIMDSIKKIDQEEIKKSIEHILSRLFKDEMRITLKVLFDSASLSKTKEAYAHISILPNIEIFLNDICIIRSFRNQKKSRDKYEQLEVLTSLLPTETDPALSKIKKAISNIVEIVPHGNFAAKKQKRESSINLGFKKKLCKSLSSELAFSTIGTNPLFKENSGLKAFPRSLREQSRRRSFGFIKPTAAFKKLTSSYRYSKDEFLTDTLNEIYFILISLISKEMRSAVFSFFGKIEYLAGYRIYLEREINQQTLRDIQQNDPYGTVEIKNLLSSEKNTKILNNILKRFQSPFLVSKKGNIVKKVVLVNRRIKKGEWTFKDFGFGWSQVFPFILKMINKNYSALFVEQPELHLSSSYQQKLMDLIIENTFSLNGVFQDVKKDKNVLFLECHSDIMVFRLLKRIREKKNEKPYSHKDFSILYIKEGPDGSSISTVPIDSQGFLSEKWSDGILELAAKDLVS